MPRFKDEMTLVQKRAEVDPPEDIVVMLKWVGERFHLDRPCRACFSAAGVMCTNKGGAERSTVHTERLQEERWTK